MIHGLMGKRNEKEPKTPKPCCSYAVGWRCEVCHGLQWPSYGEVAGGSSALPSLSDCCMRVSQNNSPVSADHAEVVSSDSCQLDIQCDGPDENMHCFLHSLLDTCDVEHREIQADETTANGCVLPTFPAPKICSAQLDAVKRARLQGARLSNIKLTTTNPFLDSTMPVRDRGRQLFTQLHDQF